MQYENRLAHCQTALGGAFHRILLAGFECLLPPHCVLCAQPSNSDCLCAHCRNEMVFAGPHCRRCGLPLAQARDALCGRCLRRRPLFATTVYPLQYRFPADRLVQAFKFRREHAAGRVLAGLMCEHIAGNEILYPDTLVPVPLHPIRLFKRGFNQAYELAAYVARTLDIPLQAGALRRRRNTRAQSGLDRKQRRRNVKGAFYWHGAQPPRRHVALVDDVMTTGTTVGECTRVLKRAGADRVDVWLAARAARAA